MHSQDSPRPGRASPITISAPASARGRVPLTARSAASGRSVQYVGDANPDTLVSSQPNRSANTDTSPAQNGQSSNPSTFGDGTVPPPPTFSRSSAEGEDYTSPRGDLPSQDHADPAPSPASPLANALAQVADTLTTVTTGIAAPERPGKARKGPERPGKAWKGPDRPGKARAVLDTPGVYMYVLYILPFY